MVEINGIENEDLEALSHLLQELSGSKTNVDKMVQNYEYVQQNSDYILLGAKYKGELVGTVMGIICKDFVGECKPFMVIENVVVKSEVRGMKIGKKLMHEIENIGRERDCYYTMFVSLMSRKDAHKFYESVGYSFDTVQGFKKYL